MSKCLLLTLFLLSSVSAYAGKKAAIVKIIKGDVFSNLAGAKQQLKINDWVETGAVLTTGDRSFVKIIFLDKSQMNIGPKSELKIEKFSGNDSGIVEFVKGKVRSMVTKDYLQIAPDRSKLFIKTNNSVIGVRGTDFLVSTNGKSTSTVLFEGSIAFNTLENKKLSDSERLEEVVSRGVVMAPGEFSVVDRESRPTIPSLLNIQQREALRKARNFESGRSPQSIGKKEERKSVVPQGLNGKLVGNDTSILKKQIGITDLNSSRGGRTPASTNPESYVSGGSYKPANGSYLQIDSGSIIPPPAESVYDPNSNTYIAPDSGSLTTSGEYVPAPVSTTVNTAPTTIVSPDNRTVTDFTTYSTDMTKKDGGAYTPGTTGQTYTAPKTNGNIIISPR